MAVRLLKAGHECVVYDSHSAVVQDMIGKGAVGATALPEFVKRLGPEEILQFLSCVQSIKHCTILTICYAAGPRASPRLSASKSPISIAKGWSFESSRAQGRNVADNISQSIFSPPSRRSPFVASPSPLPPRRWPKNALRYGTRSITAPLLLNTQLPFGNEPTSHDQA